MSLQTFFMYNLVITFFWTSGSLPLTKSITEPKRNKTCSVRMIEAKTAQKIQSATATDHEKYVQLPVVTMKGAFAPILIKLKCSIFSSC